MSATGLEVFDTTLQETNHWLKLMMGELGTADRHPDSRYGLSQQPPTGAWAGAS
jgi:hypothetical protein